MGEIPARVVGLAQQMRMQLSHRSRRRVGCDGEKSGWYGGIRPTDTTRATCVRAMIGINSWRRNSLVLHRDVDDKLVAFARRQRLCKVASTSFTDGLSATWTAKKRIEQAVSKRHRTHGSSPSDAHLELGDT